MMRKLGQLQKDNQGFTLVELMIVVAIIGILAAIAVPQFMSYRIRSTNSNAKALMKSLSVAQANMNAEIGAYGNIDPTAAGGWLGQAPVAANGASAVADSSVNPVLASDAGTVAAALGGRINGTNGATAGSLSVAFGIGANMAVQTATPAVGGAGVNTSTAWCAKTRHINGDTTYTQDSELPNAMFRVSNPAWPRTAGFGAGAVALVAKVPGTNQFDADANPSTADVAGGGAPTLQYALVD